MNQLKQDVLKYVLVARKTRGALMSFKKFNSVHNTSIPENDVAFEKFNNSVKRAKKHGFPITARLFDLYSEFTPTLSPPTHRSIIPSPPISHLDQYKKGLEEWKKNNPNSKLNSETQIVYFVPNEKVDNYEHFSSKLTKSTGAILQTGGIFKMRSGMKKELYGLDEEKACEIITRVKNGDSGPFYLPMACVTGASICNCK